VLLSLGLLAVLLYYRKDDRLKLWVALGYLPWLFSLISGDFIDLIAFYLIYPAWYLVLDDSLDALEQYLFYGWKEAGLGRLKGRYAYLGVALLAAFLLRSPFDRAGMELLRSVSPLLAGFALAGPYMLVPFYRSWRSGHHVFTPLAIAERYPAVPIRKVLAVPAVVLLLLSPLFGRLSRPFASGSVPVPREIDGALRFDWPSLGMLWNERGSDDLPNIADYVAHMVYQTGFSFGQQYGLPGDDHGLTLSAYSVDKINGRISRDTKTIARLDSAWLDALLSRPKAGSLERMFLDQGTPVRVVTIPLEFFHPGFAWWKFYFLALFAVFIMFTFDFHWRPVLIYFGLRQALERIRRAA
jgi:hypothetical protein